MFERERWMPLHQVPDDTGADVGTEQVTEAPPPPSPPSDGPGSGRTALRQQLEKGFEDDRKASEKAARKTAKATKRIAGGAEIAPEAPEGAAEGAEAVEGAEVAPVGQQPAVAAPAGFSQEAKAEWAKTPVAVQAAITKREEDMHRGVQELKARYSEIDQALAPHMEAIRRHGQTPAKAVEQLFGWFQALSANPVLAFPALAKSFNYDLGQIMTAYEQANMQQQGQQPGQQPQPGQQQEQIPAYMHDLINRISNIEQGFKQELGTVQTAMQRQAEEKTNEVLGMWSKDKPYFEDVRQMMANLVQTGAIPMKNGQVDLDTAYDMAMYALPQVRQRVLAQQAEAQKKAAADKIAAEKKLQQEQADKARRAAVAISGSAPGVPGDPNAKPRVKGKSVRESLLDAQRELTERD